MALETRHAPRFRWLAGDEQGAGSWRKIVNGAILGEMRFALCLRKQKPGDEEKG